MKSILEILSEKYQQVEIYKVKQTISTLTYKNNSVHSIDNQIQSAITVRAIDHGCLANAYTRNLQSTDKLINDLDNSFLGNVKADFSFPHSPLVEALDSYDPQIESLSFQQLAEQAADINRLIKNQCQAEVESYLTKSFTEIELINSNGSDLLFKSSQFNNTTALIYPGSGWGMEYNLKAKNFTSYDYDQIQNLIQRYKLGIPTVKPDSGKMQVLFMPTALYTLTWRIATGLDSKYYYYDLTPLKDKKETRIFDEKLSIYNDPLDDLHPGCRPFDDEGVVCHRHDLIKNGVFKQRFNDLKYAAKLNEKPTGHGWKNSLTGQPAPGVKHLRMGLGKSSLTQMIQSIDKGIILEGVLGAHSGNIPNGDFSVGVNPALYVENGKIIGRIKDAMVTGNIYNVLKNVNTIENKMHPSGSNWLPALLIDDVQVSA